MTLAGILLLIAAIFFVVAAALERLSLVSLGLFFWVLSILLPQLHRG